MDIKNEGFIKSITSTFGIIETDNFGPILFTVTKSIRNYISEGDKVSFNILTSKNNRTEAINIELIEKFKGLKKSNKQKFKFLDKSDFYLAAEFIKERLEFQLEFIENFNDSSEVETEINYLLDILSDIITGEEPNIKSIEISHLNLYEFNNSKRNEKNYWLHNFNLQDFAIRLIRLGKYETKKKINHQFDIVWGEWRHETRRIIKSGYDNRFFDYSYAEPNETSFTNRYTASNFKSEWIMKKVNQGDSHFYISSAPAQEISQASYVPSLPPIMNVDDTAKRVLDINHGENEWQRQIDVKRVLKIKQFIQDSNNLVANTPMLFVRKNNAVEIKNDKLIINYESFLQKETTGPDKGVYIDRRKREDRDDAGNLVWDDFRPLWLVDGQHRIRGVNQSDRKELEIPIIVFPNEFGEQQTGKIFAEINTLQKPLNQLHELFMQHRFKIDHVDDKSKFRDYKKVDYVKVYNEPDWGNGRDWLNSRANHLAYEIAAKLASEGVLKNKIQFLPQNDKESTFTDAYQWVKYSRDLFFKCYEYNGEGINKWITKPSTNEKQMSEFDFFYKEINNYFKAWIEICNHSEWEKNKPKSWQLDISIGSKRGLIQMRAYFIILLQIYNIVRNKAVKNINGYQYSKRILEKNDFLKVLNVFKWVDWNSKDLKQIYKGGGEKPRRSLERWMCDAILHGKSYSKDEIMNTPLLPDDFLKNKSKPGRGICSYLEDPKIKITSENKWPTKKKHVKFESKRPYNARYEALWSVFDENDNLLDEKKSSANPNSDEIDNYSKYILKFPRGILKAKKLKIQVEWQNIHIRRGSCVKILEKKGI
tara:strand:+ start:4261 stop:6720 length:2460 start_codon:yes stop_codon:yes gene_type:complete